MFYLKQRNRWEEIFGSLCVKMAAISRGTIVRGKLFYYGRHITYPLRETAEKISEFINWNLISYALTMF